MQSKNKGLAAASERIPKALTFRVLLRPHLGALSLGLIAVVGESAANLLQPWPLKIVLDDVLRSRGSHEWVKRLFPGSARKIIRTAVRLRCCPRHSSRRRH